MIIFFQQCCAGGMLFLSIFLLGSGALLAKEAGGDLTDIPYIEVPPLAITMYHQGRPKGSMTIQALVKVTDGDKRAVAVKLLPRLSNAYVFEANRLSHNYFDVSRPVDIGLLGDVFQAATNRVLGHQDGRLLISDVVVNQK